MHDAATRRRIFLAYAPVAARAANLALLLAALAALPAQAGQTTVVQLDPGQTSIAFLLEGSLHDTHGTFKLKTGTMQFDPATGAASGSIVVDVTSGDTGNSSRDRKMHSDVLESAKFGEAVFTPQQLIGSVAPEGASRVDVKGLLHIHGADHAVTMRMSVTTAGGKITAQTEFGIPYAEWGMKDPSNFLLRVSGSVSVEISAAGRITTTP
jgi:polyisoprenoid-binding protein YceI